MISTKPAVGRHFFRRFEFKGGKKRRSQAFYTGTSCLKGNCPVRKPGGGGLLFFKFFYFFFYSRLFVFFFFSFKSLGCSGEFSWDFSGVVICLIYRDCVGGSGGWQVGRRGWGLGEGVVEQNA